MRYPFVTVSLFLIELMIIGCAVGALALGVKQLRNGREQVAQQSSLIFWLYIAIAALAVSEVLIFL